MSEAQDLHPGHIQEKILANSSFSYTFDASGSIEVVSFQNASQSQVVIEKNGIKIEYKFIYTPESGFNGMASFVVAWPTILNREVVAYTRIDISVVPSLLDAKPDFAVVRNSDVSALLDVTSNDTPGSGNITLTNIELVQNGQASIEGDQIRFTPDADFTGSTSFVYNIIDEDGYQVSGIVTVQVFDSQGLAGSTLSYSVLSGEMVYVLLDDASYAVSDRPIELSQVSELVWAYEAPLNYAGTQEIRFQNDNGDLVTAQIQVIDNETTGDYVNDDEVFTSVGSTVTFDPFANDYGVQGVLVDFSSELVWTGTEFSFTPDPNYAGYKEFFYTVFDGNQEITGIIEIFIGNYLPQKESYFFTAKQGTPFAIEYDAPIKDYLWSEINSPSNGILSKNLGSYIYESCTNSISGNKLVIYRPNDAFVGQDQFTIEYCAGNGECKQVDITIDVQATTESCHCYGDDCVWSGDTDNNGKVSVQDLLGIGYNYGASGELREQSNNDWCANFAGEWSFDQEGGSMNNKFADANGDGIINVADTVGIAENYNSYHDIASREVLAEKDDVLAFTTEATSISIGEVIEIDVTLGSSDQPVIDRQGIAFGIQFPVETINPDNIRFIPNTSWFGNGSPVLTMSQSKNGYIEIGMVRVSNKGANGVGGLGTFQIEGNEDLDGLRPEDEEIPIQIEIDDAVVTDGSGSRYAIQSEGLELIFSLSSSISADLAPEVNVFPNPSDSDIQFSAKSGDLIQEISIHAITGAQALLRTNIAAQNYSLSHDLAEGMYVATIRTDRGIVNESIVVSRSR